MKDVILKFKNACGCSTGKYFTIAGIFFYIAFVIYFRTYIHLNVPTNIGIFFYFIFCFAIIGKAAGLAGAYLSFKKALRNKI